MIKPTFKQNPLDEAHTLGYLEGFSDGRNKILEQLVKLKLLKKNWKKEYNQKCKEDGYLIK